MAQKKLRRTDVYNNNKQNIDLTSKLSIQIEFDEYILESDPTFGSSKLQANYSKIKQLEQTLEEKDKYI